MKYIIKKDYELLSKKNCSILIGAIIVIILTTLLTKNNHDQNILTISLGLDITKCSNYIDYSIYFFQLFFAIFNGYYLFYFSFKSYASNVFLRTNTIHFILWKIYSIIIYIFLLKILITIIVMLIINNYGFQLIVVNFIFTLNTIFLILLLILGFKMKKYIKTFLILALLIITFKESLILHFQGVAFILILIGIVKLFTKNYTYIFEESE